MQSVEQTIISQYANSPTLAQLVRDMDAYIDPRADFDAFYETVWNVQTAQGFGLDIWGRIVGVSRHIHYPSGELNWLGFKEGTGQPFGQQPFRHDYVGLENIFTLADNAYRTLILVKAMANISACTAPSINQMLQNLFAGRGRCYALDLGEMEMSYVFEFDLQPYELVIMTNSGVFPHPAAVLINVINVRTQATFGFEGSGLQPFGSGAFFTPTNLVPHHAA
jgi:hypothetical protein